MKRVEKYLMRKIKREEKLHLSLIDPAEQSPEKAIFLAEFAADAGTDAILIGGSYAVKHKKLNDTTRGIKETIDLPVILFPSSTAYLSEYADAIFFLSLLNSKDPKYIIREPARGAPIIKKMNLEPISVAYLIIKPGMRAGKKGKAHLVKRDDIQSAIQYALFAQFAGMHFLYLEAGSGSPKPVPDKMIRAVKNEVSVPVIVGGGIINAKIAKEKAEAGADIIVTGNICEKDSKALKSIISAVKNTK